MKLFKKKIWSIWNYLNNNVFFRAHSSQKKKLTSYITIIHIFQKQKEEVAAEVIGGIDRTMKNRSNSTRSTKKKTRIEQYQRELKQAGHCSGVHVNPKPTPQKQPITELGWGDLWRDVLIIHDMKLSLIGSSNGDRNTQRHRHRETNWERESTLPSPSSPSLSSLSLCICIARWSDVVCFYLICNNIITTVLCCVSWRETDISMIYMYLNKKEKTEYASDR